MNTPIGLGWTVYVEGASPFAGQGGPRLPPHARVSKRVSAAAPGPKNAFEPPLSARAGRAGVRVSARPKVPLIGLTTGGGPDDRGICRADAVGDCAHIVCRGAPPHAPQCNGSRHRVKGTFNMGRERCVYMSSWPDGRVGVGMVGLGSGWSGWGRDGRLTRCRRKFQGLHYRTFRRGCHRRRHGTWPGRRRPRAAPLRAAA